ncbi:hypothetical protein JB92DRAFT_666390 [Gautieria morchelliformis]|nr:hypothetical protein JB92DRAFT_666390 [Gautieria morchelliformis]
MVESHVLLTGSTLALFTVNEDLLSLRMYDVRRRNKRARAAIKLPAASSQLADGVWPEVRTAAWSPDGILLAVGKNDDVAHVYDVRCLGRGPVVSLRHHTRKSQYGITMLAWTAETNLRTPNLGLVTGGGDRALYCIVGRAHCM